MNGLEQSLYVVNDAAREMCYLLKEKTNNQNPQKWGYGNDKITEIAESNNN